MFSKVTESITASLLVLWVSTGGLCAVGADKSTPLPDEELLADVNRITTMVRGKDLSALRTLARQIEEKWSDRDPELYAQVMLKLSSACASNFGGEKSCDLARENALTALAKLHSTRKVCSIPIRTELTFLMYSRPLRASTQYRRAAQAEGWQSERSQMARFYLHAWGRLANAIDPNWDPKSRPPARPTPPAGVGRYVGGMGPEQIEDPELRGQYEQALEQWRQKFNAWNRQLKLRRLQEDLLPRVKTHLVQLYSAPSFDGKTLETEALQADLALHVPDPKLRAQILTALTEKLQKMSTRKTQIPPGGRASSRRGGESE